MEKIIQIHICKFSEIQLISPLLQFEKVRLRTVTSVSFCFSLGLISSPLAVISSPSSEGGLSQSLIRHQLGGDTLQSWFYTSILWKVTHFSVPQSCSSSCHEIKYFFFTWSTIHLLLWNDASVFCFFFLLREIPVDWMISVLSQPIFNPPPIATGHSPTNLWDSKGSQLFRGLSFSYWPPPPNCCTCLISLAFMPHERSLGT